MSKFKLDTEEEADQAEVLATHLMQLMKGNPPGKVGAALALVVATFINGHAPKLRFKAHVELLKLVDELLPVILEEMIAHGVVPPGWRDEKKGKK
jgi:hypothetical protein